MTFSVTKGGTIETFKYDALNRQVTRTIDGARYDSIWDGWNLILNYTTPGNAWTNAYWHGPGGMLAEWASGTSIKVSYSDASGSTTQLADGTTGALLEWYRYDLDGTPIIYDANGNLRTASAYDIRHLFTGQQWYSELGLYDLRNRFYSPDTGRFLQPDPIGFGGDATNLYRYCANNPLTRSDAFGLEEQFRPEKGKDNVGYSNGTTGELWGVGGSPENPSNFGISGSGDDGLSDQALVSGGPVSGGPGGGSYGGPSGGFLGGVSGGLPGNGVFGGGNGGGAGDGGGGGHGGLNSGRGGTSGGIPGGVPGGPPSGVPGGMPGSRPGGLVAGIPPSSVSPYGPGWEPFIDFLKRPPSAETAAWTNSGRTPTLILTGIVFAPAIAPETGLPVLNAYLTNPVYWNSLVAASGPTIAGFGGGQPLNYPANQGQFHGQLLALGWREVRAFYGWLSNGW